MSETTSKTKKAWVVKDFNDAGTETKFAASIDGKPETYADVEEGAFANYEAAGLVRAPDEAKPTPAKGGGKADA